MTSPSELQIAAEHLPVAIWMGRVPSGEVVYTNAAFREVLGLEVPPDAGRGGFVEPYGVHKRDGSPYPESEMPFERCLAARATVVVDDIVIHRRDGRHVNLRVFAKPIFDDAGEMTHVLEAFTDVTREVEAEVARVEGERRLARSQRLESIGHLVAGIAHDFNNLLTVTKLMVSRLRAREKDFSNLEALADVDTVTDSAISLIRSLLGFAGRSNQVLASIEVGPVVTSVVDLAKRTFDRRIELSTAIRSDHAHVRADRAELEQVLMNLLVNARDAIDSEAGQVVVRVEARALAAGEIESCPAGDYVVLEVADTGSGISADIRDRVFEPYFTTKTKGPVKGTGLGLSTVHGIVRGHSGFIEVAHNRPRGTVMRIALPRVEAEDVAVESAQATPPRPIDGGGRLVLVVDDERLVREASRGALEGLRFSVVEAEHGAHALEVFAEHENELSAVVLDLVMPGLSTAEILRTLHARRPGLPVLMVTGSTIDDELRGVLAPHVRGWLPKPFGDAELADAFRRFGI